jgi:hypothetical protein
MLAKAPKRRMITNSIGFCFVKTTISWLTWENGVTVNFRTWSLQFICGSLLEHQSQMLCHSASPTGGRKKEK